MAPLLVWFLYINLVALLLSLAGWLAERVLLAVGGETRLGWSASMLLTVLLPLGALLLGGQFLSFGAVSALDEVITSGLVSLSGHAVSYTPGGGYRLATDYHLWIAGFWVICTGVTLIWLARSLRQLRSARAEWHRSDGGEEEIYLTSSLGPGVTGVLRQRILLPRWVMGLPEEEREMIVLHEREHVRAGDNPLLAGAFALVILFPWILPLWWQFRRLRVAVELDCDRRVVRRCGEPRRYGELLIRVAEGSTLLPVAPFATGSSPLRRRIRSLAEGEPPGRPLTAALAGLAICGFMIAALALPVPTAEANWSLLPLPNEPLVQTLDPPLHDYDRDPTLENEDEIERLARRHYPEELRRRGIEGRVGLLVHITPEGRVDQVRLDSASSHAGFNRAAVRIAERLRYRPARWNDAPTDVWWMEAIDFRLP